MKRVVPFVKARETALYGSKAVGLGEATRHGLELDFRQSNHEGVLIDWLHEAGRAYAAYGGVYIGVALLWLWAVDQVRPSVWDCAGAAVALAGMAIIVFQPSR